MSKWREYRKGFANIVVDSKPSRSVFVGSTEEWIGAMRMWSIENGYFQHESAKVTLGGFSTGVDCFSTGVDWGFGSDGHVKMGLVMRALVEITAKRRVEWPDDAKDACLRVEQKLHEVFGLLDDETEKREALERKAQQLERDIEWARRSSDAAGRALDEMKRRLREANPDHARRSAEAACAERIAQLEQEAASLRAKLHEAESRESKLADDKKRLRAALNGARSGAR